MPYYILSFLKFLLVVDHNNSTTNINGPALLDDSTVVLTTTESVTTTKLVTTTEITTKTTIIYRTVTANVTSTLSPSPVQNSGAACSNSCSSDDNNTPIYVAVAMVIIVLLITVTAIIVGVFLFRRYWQEKQSGEPNSSLNVKYKTTEPSLVSMVEVENDLYGKEVPQSR